MAHDRGCLKCQVIWYGDDECWFCNQTTFTVGASVIGMPEWKNETVIQRYYEVEDLL